MNENQSGSGNLLDTTDCLEAVGVFKGWKNFFFIIILLCILLLQACFWLLDLGMIPIPPGEAAGQELFTITLVFSEPNSISSTGGKEAGQIIPESNKAEEPEKTPKENETPEPSGTVTPAQPVEPNQTSKSAKSDALILLASETTVQSPNDPAAKKSSEKEFLFGITFEHVVWTIRFVNAILILTAVLYCLTMLFTLKVSMLGRLGGINHITRAFFLSLLMLVFVLPWQGIFDGVVMGAIFTPAEIVKWHAEKTSDMFDMVLYYLRFCCFMVLVFLLLVLAQIRSSRWAKAILRRLEII